MEPSVAIVGATGAVGEIMRQVLDEYRFPLRTIKFLASERSVGKTIDFRGRQYTVEPIRPEAFAGVDLVLSSTPSGVSRESSPMAAQAGAIVVDNSSAWRMDPDVPLVVPEVNADELGRIRKGIVANPNCVAIPLSVALKPLHAVAGIKRVVVATYQSSSGKGAKGLADLDAQLRSIGMGQPMPPPKAHAAQLCGNVLPHDWTTNPDGYTEEETKVMQETRKILGENIPISATCVRVPVRVSHSLAVNVEFHRAISPEQAAAAYRSAPGVVLCESKPPLPLEVTGRDEVFIGRIRRDPSVPYGLNLWVVADNLRKGAASNAVQIAQLLLRRGLVPRR
ncbi:MAG: aspartate-semialdehyde dehydrogenase [Gemmataceae bacterium]|nr:aspartate-semialdehyde dehydrogenase [Gemmataceae bacterium]MDW8264421.1 aspartate-semialdehyde dehydrogenase [Gemmataceae bacterium]